MTWTEVLNDKSLQDLPYKIELNGFGNIVMSPASNWHADYQVRIVLALRRQSKSGRILTESSVKTRDNVKCPDVVWASDEFMKKHKWKSPYTAAPEICVEVLSPGNSKLDIANKRELYFEKGAKEVWLCNSEGAMSFFDPSGEIPRSAIFKRFPIAL